MPTKNKPTEVSRAKWQQVVDAVERAGRERIKAQPAMNDADFLAGALAAMKELGIPLYRAPASWTLGMMFTGKSPLRDEDAVSEERSGCNCGHMVSDPEHAQDCPARAWDAERKDTIPWD